jgi:hypothetical protein
MSMMNEESERKSYFFQNSGIKIIKIVKISSLPRSISNISVHLPKSGINW